MYDDLCKVDIVHYKVEIVKKGWIAVLRDWRGEQISFMEGTVTC